MVKALQQSYGETKPGVFTTEFWLTFVVLLADFCAGLAGVLPASWTAIVGAVSAGLYALARGWSKSQIPANPNADVRRT